MRDRQIGLLHARVMMRATQVVGKPARHQTAGQGRGGLFILRPRRTRSELHVETRGRGPVGHRCGSPRTVMLADALAVFPGPTATSTTFNVTGIAEQWIELLEPFSRARFCCLALASRKRRR